MRTLGEGAAPAEGVEKRDRGESDDATQKRAKQDGQECSANAEKGADHGHHFDVTHAHAIAFADEFVERGGAPEQQAAKGRAEQCFDQVGYERRNVMIMNVYVGDSVWRNARGERESQTEAKPVDRVGKQAHAKIGDDQNQKQAGEREPLEGFDRYAEFVIGENKNAAGKKFDDRIHWGNRERAIAAFTAKQEPAQDWDVVVRLDGIEATRATRGRRDDGNIVGDASDANIQKAADDDAEKKKEDWDHKIDCAIDGEEAQ